MHIYEVVIQRLELAKGGVQQKTQKEVRNVILQENLYKKASLA